LLLFATTHLPANDHVSPQIHQQFLTEKLDKSQLTSSPETGKILTIRYSSPMTAPCKHPIVKIVSREEDAEFVECQSCGEIFDSAEFSDIAIEEEESLEEEAAEKPKR
jgi:hypothetical protein